MIGVTLVIVHVHTIGISGEAWVLTGEGLEIFKCFVRVRLEVLEGATRSF